MGRTITEILKIMITAILSVFMTVVLLSGTVIRNKADKKYVDKQDSKLEKKIETVEENYKEEDKKLKADYIREMNRMNGVQEIIQTDIKKILEKI